jgi:endogenous inhibitor of DNA gyrase (YacG/DUF329 family)
MNGTSSPPAPADGLRRVPCPTCKGPAVYHASNPWRPFCSERCRTADLGAWASERFRVPGEAPSDDDPNVPSAP